MNETFFSKILICIFSVCIPFGMKFLNICYQYMLLIQTELCGWGVEAAETINKGEFIIEYIGEGSSQF